jgi:hypothetical protein
MEPSAIVSTARTAIGAGSILLRIRKWVQQIRNGSARFTYPSNRECITELPIRIGGTHMNLRHGSYWLLLASGTGYIPLQRLSMLPDGKWSSKIDYLKHESGKPVVIALAWTTSLVDALLDKLSGSSSGLGNETAIVPDQRCLRVDEELVLQVEVKTIPRVEDIVIPSSQSLVGIGLTAQEQQFLDTRDSSTASNLNDELLELLCEQPDAGSFVAELKRLANKLANLDFAEPQINHILKGDASHLIGNIIILRKIASHLLWSTKFSQKIHTNLVIPLLLYCSEYGQGPPEFHSAFSAARRVDSFTGEYADVPDEAIELIEKVLNSEEPLSSSLSFADLARLTKICPAFGEDELKVFRELMSDVDPIFQEIVVKLDETYATRHENQKSSDS